MALKYFTNATNGYEGKSIAINPAHVVSCFETPSLNGDVTTIYTVTGLTYLVTDSYMESVARLNEV
jgi:hypothetical protein